MLIADTNEFHPLVDGSAYAAGKAADGSAYSVVIIRATYSNTHVDNAYASSIAQARKGGLLVGHYGYLTASVDAGLQGTFFGQTVKANGGLLPGDSIWCDCEEGSGDQSARVAAFIQAAHAVLNDGTADEGFYSGESFYAAHLGAVESGLHRWIAAYGQATAPAGSQLWQFTDSQTMPGVQGSCDCSIFNGTRDQWLALVGGSGSAPQPVTHPAPAPAPVQPAAPAPAPVQQQEVSVVVPEVSITNPGPNVVSAWVKAIQGILNAKLNAGLVCDGRLGAATNNEIMRFQGAHGLKRDGVVGPLTADALLNK